MAKKKTPQIELLTEGMEARFRTSPTVRAALDKFCSTEDRSVSSAVRMLMKLGLRQRGYLPEIENPID